MDYIPLPERVHAVQQHDLLLKWQVETADIIVAETVAARGLSLLAGSKSLWP